MRYEGYIDALSNNGETIKLAMDLMLPFYSGALEVAWFFVPWFALFAVAWATFKFAGRQAKPGEILRPVSIFVVIAICLIPIPPSQTTFDRSIGLGPYLAYSGLKSFNDLVVETVTAAQAEAMNGQPVPLSALRTMNQQYANLFKESDLNPLLNDYWANCTVGVVDLNKRPPQHYQAVGLLGPGLLGLHQSDIESSQEYLRSLNGEDGPLEYVRRNPGRAAEFDSVDNNRANWSEIRSEMRPVLASVQFPKGTGRTYRLPTKAYWQNRMGESVEGGQPNFLTVDSFGQDSASVEFAEKQFINPEVYEAVYGPNPVPGATHDRTQFWADDCFKLYQMAHTGLNEWYQAYQTAFDIPPYEVSEVLYRFEDFEAATSRAAYAGALQTLYDGSLAKRLNEANSGNAMNALDPKGDTYSEATGDLIAEIQGWMQAITSFFLELNLDQWVLTLIGSLGLAIAFLLVLFPFFVPFAFMSAAGENTITVVFKVIVMLQLTLSMAYIIATIGASIMAVINAYAATSYESDGLSTMSIAGLAVAINTACLIFPLYAGKLAYLALFGSMATSAPDGQTVSAGSMAMTTIIAGAIASRMGGRVTRPISNSINKSNRQAQINNAAHAAVSSNLKSSGLNRRVNQIDKTMQRQMAEKYREGGRRGLKSDLSAPRAEGPDRPDRSGRFTSDTASSAGKASSKDYRGNDPLSGFRGDDPDG